MLTEYTFKTICKTSYQSVGTSHSKIYVNLCTALVDLELKSNGSSILVLLHSMYVHTQLGGANFMSYNYAYTADSII